MALDMSLDDSDPPPLCNQRYPSPALWQQGQTIRLGMGSANISDNTETTDNKTTDYKTTKLQDYKTTRLQDYKNTHCRLQTTQLQTTY